MRYFFFLVYDISLIWQNEMFWVPFVFLNRYPFQKSCHQQLEGGKLYYLEALHSNYIDNDHVRIHIKFPGSNITRSLDKEYLFLYSPGKKMRNVHNFLMAIFFTCLLRGHYHGWSLKFLFFNFHCIILPNATKYTKKFEKKIP